MFIRVYLWLTSWLVVWSFAVGAQQHRGLQVGAGREAGDTLRRDFHGPAATRVANLPGFAVGHSESAETGEGDMVAARQTCLYSVEECVQRPRRLRSRQPCIDGDFADQVFLVHMAPNARELYRRRIPVSIVSRLTTSSAGGWKRTICYTAVSGNNMDQNTVRLIAGVLAVLLVVIVVMRRKKKKGVDEEF